MEAPKELTPEQRKGLGKVTEEFLAPPPKNNDPLFSRGEVVKIALVSGLTLPLLFVGAFFYSTYPGLTATLLGTVMSVALIFSAILRFIHYKNKRKAKDFLTAPVMTAGLFIGLGVALALLPTFLSLFGIPAPFMGMLFDIVGPAGGGSVVLATISLDQFFVIGGALLAGLTAIFNVLHFRLHQQELIYPTEGNKKSFYKRWKLTSLLERFGVGAFVTACVSLLLLAFFSPFEGGPNIAIFSLAPIFMIAALLRHGNNIILQRRGETPAEIKRGIEAETQKIAELQQSLEDNIGTTVLEGATQRSNLVAEKISGLVQTVAELARLAGLPGALTVAGSSTINNQIAALTRTIEKVALEIRSIARAQGTGYTVQGTAYTAQIARLEELRRNIINIGHELLQKEGGSERFAASLENLSLSLALLESAPHFDEYRWIKDAFERPPQKFRLNIFKQAPVPAPTMPEVSAASGVRAQDDAASAAGARRRDSQDSSGSSQTHHSRGSRASSESAAGAMRVDGVGVHAGGGMVPAAAKDAAAGVAPSTAA